MSLVRIVLRDSAEGHLTLPRPGQCTACDQGWQRVRADARRDDNFKHAWDLRRRV